MREQVVLHGHGRWELAGGNWLCGGPSERVGRATGDLVDLFALQSRDETRPRDRRRRTVSKLTLVVVTPRVNLT